MEKNIMEQPVDASKGFVSILNNKKDELGGKKLGVLLLVGPERDLTSLEEACYASYQTHNGCLAARYTLKAAEPEMVFGTFLQTLIGDVLNMSTDTLGPSEF